MGGRAKGTWAAPRPPPSPESQSNGPERSPLHCKKSPSPSHYPPLSPQGTALPRCERGGGGTTSQQVLVIPPPPAPCTSLAFHPPLHPHGPSSWGSFLPTHPPSPPPKESTSLQTDGGGARRREMKGAPWLPWERTEPPVPGREPKRSHRLPGASREGPGLQPQTPPPGQLGVPGLREPPPEAEGCGVGCTPPARGRASQVPEAARPTPPCTGAPQRALAPTVQKPRAEAAPLGPGPGCRRRAHSAPLLPGRGAPAGAQARPGPGAAAAPAPPPLQRPPPPAPPVANAERPSRRLWRAAGRVASAPAI